MTRSEPSRVPPFVTSATIHEAAGRIGALPARIKPVDEALRIAGPAFPVRAAPGDNYWIHQAIYAARSGDVLVVDVGDTREFGYWGEIMSEAATARRLGGLVIDGGVRDVTRLREIGFPVFAALISIRGTAKDDRTSGSIGEPVQVGDVDVHPGDLVVADVDGAVVVPGANTDAVMDAAQQREAHETDLIAQLRDGARTLDLLGLGDHDPTTRVES